MYKFTSKKDFSGNLPAREALGAKKYVNIRLLDIWTSVVPSISDSLDSLGTTSNEFTFTH